MEKNHEISFQNQISINYTTFKRRNGNLRLNLDLDAEKYTKNITTVILM